MGVGCFTGIIVAPSSQLIYHGASKAYKHIKHESRQNITRRAAFELLYGLERSGTEQWHGGTW